MRKQSPLEDLKQQIRNFFRSLAIVMKAFTMCPPFIYEGQIIRPLTPTFDRGDRSWMEEDWKVTKVEFPYFWAEAFPDSWYTRVLGQGKPYVVKFDLRNQTFMEVEATSV